MGRFKLDLGLKTQIEPIQWVASEANHCEREGVMESPSESLHTIEAY